MLFDAEQVCNLLLCQPYGLLFKSYLQSDRVVWLIKNDFASFLLFYHNHAFLFAIIDKSFFTEYGFSSKD